MAGRRIPGTSHIHPKKDGTFTGIDIPDESDPNKHTHAESDGPTSLDSYGEGHVHEGYRGDISGEPINISTDQALSLAKALSRRLKQD